MLNKLNSFSSFDFDYFDILFRFSITNNLEFLATHSNCDKKADPINCSHFTKLDYGSSRISSSNLSWRIFLSFPITNYEGIIRHVFYDTFLLSPTLFKLLNFIVRSSILQSFEKFSVLYLDTLHLPFSEWRIQTPIDFLGATFLGLSHNRRYFL